MSIREGTRLGCRIGPVDKESYGAGRVMVLLAPVGSSGTKMNCQSCPALNQSGQAFIKKSLS